MVRAGEGAYLIDEFRKKNIVATGWNRITDLSSPSVDKKTLVDLVKKYYPEYKEGKVFTTANQLYKFSKIIQKNDSVITYDPTTREYLVGKISSDYKYNTTTCKDFYHIRTVDWFKSINRDDLSTSTKNSIGAISTLFEIKETAMEEVEALASNKKLEVKMEDEGVDELGDIKEDIIERSNEFIKDKVMKLDWDEMQELVAGILRAMGFKTRVSEKGSDRGKDIIASPDGLGLEDPKILVEVKHRSGQMGSQEIRSFIGAVRSGSKGLYVSTGGFTKDAKYEAERASFPITLIDSDELIRLIVQYYDNFDNDIRSLVPLTKVYWPV